ncbi:hypothetical protein C8J57DRAFT_1470524 [Mycena rebaudengoi]|nr:hypothetical protein C8J57DRAFT_1470524 [Mycena rebaudengoi]
MNSVSLINQANQSVGAGRLSADLICEILLFLLDGWEKDSNSYNRGDIGNPFDGNPFDHDEVLVMDIPIAPNLPQLALTQGCRQWRLVALDFPRFWSSFLVSIRGDHRNSGSARIQGHIAALHAWMRRSGEYPMNISVQCRSWDAPGLEGLLEDLIGYGQRLKSAKLSLPTPFFSVLGALSGAQVPNLERLAIIAWEYFDPETAIGVQDNFLLEENLWFVATAPQLAHLSVHVLDGNCTRLPPLPHNDLHNWQIMPSSDEDWLHTHDVHAANLTSLQLQVFAGSQNIDPDTILRTLVAPNLHTLTLAFKRATAPDALNRFLTRSKPPLRFLKHMGSRISRAILFELCTELEELHLHYCHNDLSDALTVQGGSGAMVPCPRLRVFTVDDWGAGRHYSDATHLEDMLRSRTYAIPQGANVTRLDRVHLGCGYKGNDLSDEELPLIRQAGTELTIEDHGSGDSLSDD